MQDTTPTKPTPPTTKGSVIASSQALSLLLSEDPLLQRYNLTSISSSQEEECGFSYAAELLQSSDPSWISPSSNIQQRAAEALSEVDRKLALVNSLYEKVARESPEVVAYPLLHLHGFSSDEEKKSGETVLIHTREKCNRIQRQGEMLYGVSKRVEQTLSKGLARMESATMRLSRVLELSATLKMVMKLQFEMKKVEEGCCGSIIQGGNVPYLPISFSIDLRDLTRAAASVASMEELLTSKEFLACTKIQVVEKLRPRAETAAKAVRAAAAGLLKDKQRNGGGVSSELGAVLQVYYHLGELGEAVWGEVSDCLSAAEKASSQFFNPAAIQRIGSDARAAVEAAAMEDATSSLKKKRMNEREFQKKLREKRAEAASKWAAGLADASLQVWNLHRVLLRKSDPVTRQNFLKVFSETATPESFVEGEEALFNKNKEVKDLFSIYWYQLSIALGSRIQRILKYDNGSIARDVAALYPAVRAAALTMLDSFMNAMQAGATDDSSLSTSSSHSGILGGSCLDDTSLPISGLSLPQGSSNDHRFAATADCWTQDPDTNSTTAHSTSNTTATPFLSSSSSVTSCTEWKTLQGSPDSNTGLAPLQKAFIEACFERLANPLQYLFPETTSTNAPSQSPDAASLPVLPTLPSRYDIAKLDSNIREELSLADPREGGGEFGMTVLIAHNVVAMIHRFCKAAQTATSNAGEEGYLHPDGTAIEALQHDIKHVTVMSSLAAFLKNAPEKTYVLPYRPAPSPQHEEAARLCQIALRPAVNRIQQVCDETVLIPLRRALNRRIARELSQIHHGAYVDDASSDTESFVQSHLSKYYEEIANIHLSKLPQPHSFQIALQISTFSIYTFVSNLSLLRPIHETARLRMTQDLADLELTLEQFLFKAGAGLTLSQMESGRPYAELRAMRPMLFWNLEDENALPLDIAKSILREGWIKDVRPSTILHYLFSFAPALLSSPHHYTRQSAGDYVNSVLVDYSPTLSSIQEGEEKAWMTVIQCCDAFSQRESVGSSVGVDGDKRVSNVLMILGPELLRRRRQFF